MRSAIMVVGGACLLTLGMALLSQHSHATTAGAQVAPSNSGAAEDAPPKVEFGLATDDSVDYDALLGEAKKTAQALYERGEVSRLSWFSPDSLSQYKDLMENAEKNPGDDTYDNLQFGEIGTAPIIQVRKGSADDSRAAEKVDAYYERIARRLGSYQRGAVRPAAIASAMEIATWQLIAGVGQSNVSSDEIQRQQLAFLTSGRLEGIASSIGSQVYSGWEQPDSRFMPDGALVSVVLDDQHDISSLNIEHSTGRRAYDQSVIEALHQAAPFTAITSLQPWLKDAMTTLLFSFGHPPASPEEFRRRQQAGELALFRGRLDAELEEQGALEINHFDHMLAAIDKELVALNASRWDGVVERDAEMRVTLSLPLGVVMDVSVERGSGDVQFDRMAVRAIDHASPFRNLRLLPQAEQERYQQIMVHIHPNGVR